MINYDDSEASLLLYYNIPTISPKTIEDLHITEQEFIDKDEIDSLSVDQQFDLLNGLVNQNAGHNNNQAYDFNDHDLEDPLRKNGPNIVKELINKGVISSVHDKALSRFFISSQSFDSQRFLLNVHQDSSIEDLSASLRYLEKSIEGQTSQLKSVINENFINFVNCKKAIDNVLVGFKDLKTRAQQDMDSSKVFNPQRHKNLSKSDSLSTTLEESINNLNTASSLMIRPIMEHKNKEAKLNKLIEFIKSHVFFFDLPTRLIKHLSVNDHTQFIDDYNSYLKQKQEFLDGQEYKLRTMQQEETNPDVINNLKQEQVLFNTALSKIFVEVDKIISEYRKKIYKELLSMDHEAGIKTSANSNNARFIALVDKLYLLDTNKKTNNPIHEFFTVQLGGLKKDLEYQNKKYEAKFTMMQRKLRDYIASLADHREGGSHISHIGEKYNNIEDFFRASPNISYSDKQERRKIVLDVFESSDNLDLSIINETWLVLTNFVTYLDDLFLKNLSKFVNNYVHYNNSSNGFSIDSTGDIRDSFFTLINEAITKLMCLFNNNEAIDQMSSTPDNYSNFLPHHTNSLSAFFYLCSISGKINHWLTRVGEHVVTVGNTSKSVDTNTLLKTLRDSSVTIDQKILEALCACWVNDCSQFYDLENWESSLDSVSKSHDQNKAVHTKAMRILECYETYILAKLSQLLFDRDVSEGGKKVETVRVISAHPSKRILVSLEIQFMRSMNVLIDSIMKKYNLEKQSRIYLQKNSPSFSSNASSAFDFNNLIENDLYKVLTMNNFSVLLDAVFPDLILEFDGLFKKDLLKQNLKLYSDIDKARITILDDILVKEKAWIEDRLSKYFIKITHDKSNRAKPVLHLDGYVHEVLIHFVKLVHIVKPLTAVEDFVKIINDLQTCFLKLFLDYLRTIKDNERLVVQYLGDLKLDLNFFVEVFMPSKLLKLNDYCMNMVDIASKLIDQTQPRPAYSAREFDKLLMQGLDDTQHEFGCFL